MPYPRIVCRRPWDSSRSKLDFVYVALARECIPKVPRTLIKAFSVAVFYGAFRWVEPRRRVVRLGPGPMVYLQLILFYEFPPPFLGWF